MTRPLSRRDLLLGGSRAMLAGACLPTLRGLGLVHESAMASLTPGGGYKSLVCLFLDGGNDSVNTFAPRDSAGHAVYAASRGNLAVPRNDLLPIAPQSGGDSRQWGVHPAAPGLQSLFESGALSVVANVGTLLAPTTKAQFFNNTVPKPAQLFSHSDQITLWQLPSARDDVAWGWAGHMADLVVATHGAGVLSPAISLDGSNRLLRGQTVIPYSVGLDGSTPVYGTWGGAGNARFAALRQLLATSRTHVMERQMAGLANEAIELNAFLSDALGGAAPLATTFPNSPVGNQLRMIARLIGIRQQIGAERQVFFVRHSGYDTHDDQLTRHPELLTQLSEALVAFHAAMIELGVDDDVTLATMSEFGRTLSSNGRGSDHGWGGSQLVMGGAVQGRRFFGTMPDFTLGGPDDVGQGRLIPTIAVEQYAATLAKWYGVAPGNEINSLFPRLAQFATPDLGFLG